MFESEIAALNDAIIACDECAVDNAKQKLIILRDAFEVLSDIENLECSGGPECTCPYDIAHGLAILMSMGAALLEKIRERTQDPALITVVEMRAKVYAEIFTNIIRTDDLRPTQKEANA